MLFFKFKDFNLTRMFEYQKIDKNSSKNNGQYLSFFAGNLKVDKYLITPRIEVALCASVTLSHAVIILDYEILHVTFQLKF